MCLTFLNPFPALADGSGSDNFQKIWALCWSYAHAALSRGICLISCLEVRNTVERKVTV